MKKYILFSAIVATLLFGCSKDLDLADESPPRLKAAATINASSTQQNIRGFGGASIRGWIPDLTSAQRTKAFSTSTGIGLSVLRVRISPNSADWAAEKATIDAAKANGAIVIASAWTAPASMKDNNSLIGGKLKSSSYAAYANHLRSFNSAVGGVFAISPTNEPDWQTDYESMNNTASEVGAFIAQQGANCGAPIMGPESLNMNQSFTTTANSAAGSNLRYICGHIYGRAPYALNLGKEVWMTEHYVNSGVSGNDWPTAMLMAKEIHDCMNAGWSMYVWWYIRRSYGLLDENGNVTKNGYIMAHFSKFIRPGYSKISCTANPTAGVYTTSYKSGSKIVVVAINQNSSSTYQAFNLSGASVGGFNRYRTTSSSNLASDSFSVSGGSFGITLPASSITTLVSY